MARSESRSPSRSPSRGRKSKKDKSKKKSKQSRRSDSSPSRSRSRSRSSTSKSRKDKKKKKKNKDKDKDRDDKKEEEDRKEKNWDVAPGGLAAGLGLGPALTPASRPGIPGVNPLLLLGNPLLASIQQGGPQRRMDQVQRTVFVGGVNEQISEQELQTYLNARMASHPSRAPSPFPAPVFSVSIKRDKMYAFVEFHLASDADICMGLDNLVMKNSNLLVRRHSQYVEMGPLRGVAGLGGMPAGLGGLLTGAAPPPDPEANKIWLGPLENSLPEDDVKAFVSTFGPIRNFAFIRGAGDSKGYAFFSYVDPAITDSACTGLSGIPLCGKSVTCRRANQNQSQQNRLLAAATGGMGLDLLAASTAPILPTQMATKIVSLINVIKKNPSGEWDNEYARIAEEVKKRGAKYGSVLNVIVHPKSGTVLVEYLDLSSAGKALAALSGAMIGGNIVLTSFCPDASYKIGKEDDAKPKFFRKEETINNAPSTPVFAQPFNQPSGSSPFAPYPPSSSPFSPYPPPPSPSMPSGPSPYSSYPPAPQQPFSPYPASSPYGAPPAVPPPPPTPWANGGH